MDGDFQPSTHVAVGTKKPIRMKQIMPTAHPAALFNRIVQAQVA
jgi:hypothetical protein